MCLAATIRVAMVTRMWTAVFAFSIVLSLAAWWLWMLILSTPMHGSFINSPDVHGQTGNLPTQLAFWLVLLLSSAIFFVAYFTTEAYTALFNPFSHHILRERARTAGRNKKKHRGKASTSVVQQGPEPSAPEAQV